LRHYHTMSSFFKFHVLWRSRSWYAFNKSKTSFTQCIWIILISFCSPVLYINIMFVVTIVWICTDRTNISTQRIQKGITITKLKSKSATLGTHMCLWLLHDQCNKILYYVIYIKCTLSSLCIVHNQNKVILYLLLCLVS